MPYSSEIFDGEIKEIIKKINSTNFLDLGAGAGKYGELVKAIVPQAKTIAVEIESDYIERFSLGKIYDEVWNMSVLNLISPEYYDKAFDLVMVGDIIEHLKKSDGTDLVNYLVYRSKWIIIEFPHHYLQNAVDGYDSEAHISVWGESDFINFDSTKLYKKEGQRLVVIKGYLDDEASIMDIEPILKNHDR